MVIHKFIQHIDKLKVGLMETDWDVVIVNSGLNLLTKNRG